MKILQVNSVYKKGSTGKITYDIHSELLKDGVESIVCYGRGKTVDEKHVYKVCGEFYSHINHFFANLSGIMYGGCFISTKKLEKIIMKEHPDIVHLQCINGYFVNIYSLINWLKVNNIKTVLTLHAEFMYTANCGHSLNCTQWKTGCKQCINYKLATNSYFFNGTSKSWQKMKNAFKGFNKNLVVVSVSPWLMNRAKQSGILMDKNHKVILNGLDTSIFKKYDTKDLYNQYCHNDESIIFHVTPYLSSNKNHIKGGYYLLELAKKLKDKNVKILVAGEYEEGLIVPDNVILLGKITNQERLAQLYSMADLTVITSLKETFSMVTAESLCCGTPIVGFKAGAPEQITLEKYSEFVEQGNVDLLLNSVLKMLKKTHDKGKIEEEASLKYSKQKMVQKYIDLYRELGDKL